jgi:ubiquinone/menaquinone biosynthesis C-methylase UbiE
VTDVRERNREAFDGAFGTVYSWYMERPAVRSLIGHVVWGGRVEPNYELMREVANVPPGGVIVDAPCGTAPALERLPRHRRVRYLALDLSPVMLGRARTRAQRLGLAGVELVEGDVEAIPLADGEADLFLSLYGLHCFPDPGAAVREIGRCLRPGGRAAISTFCAGPSWRQRLIVRGAFGALGTIEDLDGWVAAAGLEVERRELSGPFAYLTAVRAA